MTRRAQLSLLMPSSTLSKLLSLLILAALALGACADPEAGASPRAGAGQDAGQDASDMRGQADLRPPQDQGPGADLDDADLGDLGRTDAGAPDMGAQEAVPTQGAALFEWLRARRYSGFASDGVVHPSNTAHGSAVKVFFNEALDASVSAAGQGPHPIGAAAVKELYAADRTTLRGWAVSVKVAEDDGRGGGWYWYEVFSTTSGERPVADGQGVGLCTGCHSQAPRDQVYWPLP